MFQSYCLAALVVLVMMTGLWLLSLRAKDASIVDRFWGMGFVLVAWALSFEQSQFTPVKALLVTCVSIWGIRLSLYIHVRNKGHGEDKRYVAMRLEHGDRFWWYSYISVFLLQGLIMLIVSAPVIFVISSPEAVALTTFTWVGFLLWAVGFVFEAGGDWQLTRFKSRPENRGKLLDTGLWSLTRHPNYFGDALQWWGVGCFALSYGTTGWLTLFGPLLMTLFIRKVSGVDLLEKDLKSSKPGYAEYIASTPPFLPKLKFWVVLIAFCLLLVWGK
jgi:steroid 5-alpha reductase family enzyme